MTEVWTCPNLKVFPDIKKDASYILIFAHGMVENIVKKGENGTYQTFLLFPQFFQKSLTVRFAKIWNYFV